MTVLASRPQAALPSVPPSWLERRLGPAWPLKVLLLGFPLWWALGFASFIFLIVAVPMAIQIAQRGRLRVPAGFGLWLLFLAWMAAGVFVLWADAPGTVDSGELSRLVGFLYRVLWYLAVTVAMLYPLSLSSRVLPAITIARWMAVLFLYCVGFGLAGILFPSFQFVSPMEMIIPGARGGSGFVHALVHPSLTTQSDFLGYAQSRPKAPFVYPNAWGNNVGLLAPFFIYVGLTSKQLWRRLAVPVVLALFALPVAFSLNRGLWLGLCLATVFSVFVLARSGRFAALYVLVISLIVAAIVLVASPLWNTITLRLDTPHSNERRASVAEVVTKTTAIGSPLLGYGTTRQVEGNFTSIAGTGTSACRQCSAPPLGTQGFLWRLIFTTGFVGTALFMAFMATQWFSHIRRRDPFSALGCMTLATSLLFFFVYDSLESPLFMLMLAIGMMNRERLERSPEYRLENNPGNTEVRAPAPNVPAMRGAP